MYKSSRSKFQAVNLPTLANEVLRNGEGEGGGGGGQGAPAPVPTPPAPKPGDGGTGTEGDAPKVFDQAEVNRIAAREKEQGRRAAEAKMAEELGMPLADVKAILAAQAAKADAEKTEVEREREKAEAERRAATTEKSAAVSETHALRIERAFLKTGLDLETLKDDERARMTRLVTVETGASYEDVLADVESVKTAFPALFGSTSGPRAPGGDPQGRPGSPKAGEDAYARGVARAQGARGRFTAVVENNKK